MARKKKSEEDVDETEAAEEAAEAEEATDGGTGSESQAVLDHRAKLEKMDETRGF